jgi:hypothetical protein
MSSFWRVCHLLPLVLLPGCGAQLEEHVVSERWVGWGLDDPFRTSGYSPLREAARRPRARDTIWLPPRVVADTAEYETRHAPLPASVLLRVEIQTYARIDCDSSAHQPPTNATEVPDYPLRMATEELAGYGPPKTTTEIWIVPTQVARHTALVRGLLGSEDANREDASFQLGFAAFANVLRQVGTGKRVFFPAVQDCRAQVEATEEILPTRVFDSSGNADKLRIGARNPYTARIVEACPARIEEHEEHLVSHHIPAWTWSTRVGPRMEKWRYTGRVTGLCAGGEKMFLATPRTSARPPD